MNKERPAGPRPGAPPATDRGLQNIQDGFFNQLRRDRMLVSILLVSGVKLAGRIRSFDKFSLLLDSEGKEQLIFKHAIATVEVSQAAAGGGSQRQE